MLSEDDKRRIRQEEEAKADARAELEAHEAIERAATQYRQHVQSVLKPKRRNPVWLLVPLLLALGLGIHALTRSTTTPPSSPTDGLGGIRDNELITQCQERISNQLGDSAAQFPSPEEITAQISASSEGKRWDGWVLCPGRPPPNRLEFSCRYTPQNQDLHMELIQP